MTRQTRFPRTSRQLAWWAGGLGAVALAALAACGGGGSPDPDEPAGDPTRITADSARSAAVEAQAFVPVCSTGRTASAAPGGSKLVNEALALLQQRHRARLDGRGGPAGMRTLALTSTRPADVLGDCGGRYGYTAYEHREGVTTATLTFDDYCRTDRSTGEQEVVDGAMSFVNTATPTPSGPISTRFEGQSSGLRTSVRDAGGTLIADQTLSFTGLSYTVGVPGGDPTAANPDRMVIGEIRQTQHLEGKERRLTGFAMTSFDTADGGSQVTYRGRGWRSNGEYFDFTTSTPIVTDGEGDYTGGALTFTGSGSSTAVLTLVPGSTMQATLTVDGQVDNSLPACSP